MKKFIHLDTAKIKNWEVKNLSDHTTESKQFAKEVRTVMRKVTLNDFIMPEYRGKDPEDYEFREDGKIVRKDRWETGIHRIHNILVEAGAMPDEREFEIDDVVNAVISLLPHGDEE